MNEKLRWFITGIVITISLVGIGVFLSRLIQNDIETTIIKTFRYMRNDAEAIAVYTGDYLYSQDLEKKKPEILADVCENVLSEDQLRQIIINRDIK